MDRAATATRTICIVAAFIGGAHAAGCYAEEIEARDDVKAGESTQPLSVAVPAVPPVAPPVALPVEHLPAAKHPGHFTNKEIRGATSSAPKATAGVGVAPPVTADVIRRQSDYLRRWTALQRRIAHLSPDEQEAQRDALKHAVVGN